MDHCLIVENSKVEYGEEPYTGWYPHSGGTITLEAGSEVDITSCTVVENESLCVVRFDEESTSQTWGGNVSVLAKSAVARVRNSILWDSGIPFGYDGGTVNIAYSCIPVSPVVPDTHAVISSSPQFLDPENGDYRLTATSPCYNTGDPNSPPDPDGTRADMGAFPRDHDPVSAEEVRPLSFSLSQNAPNPFNPVTALYFTLPASGDVSLSIFNVNGQLVRTLVDGHVDAGRHVASWDGRDAMGRPVASGVYLYRLTGPQGVATRKMLLVR